MLEAVMMVAACHAARVVVVGGGASGYFAAISAARRRPECEVVVAESAKSGLRKVLVSGGGRCNVMHEELELGRYLEHYPRGRKELRGPLASSFGPGDARRFFEDEGVSLKVESDGRVFPTSDDSRTVAGALERAARGAGVEVCFGFAVRSVDEGFVVRGNGGGILNADAVVLATGSAPAGYAIAASLGHAIEPPVPSLFSFRLMRDAWLLQLAGVSLADARLALVDTKFAQRGPVLVTHRGLSGPCALRLSAFAAKDLRARGYRGTLSLSMLPELKRPAVVEELRAHKKARARQVVAGVGPFRGAIPRRFWAALVAHLLDDEDDVRWANLSEARLQRLAAGLTDLRLDFTGKDANKEEFVTAGGVRLAEIRLKTYESKLVPGLHFAGELCDCDGVTGGFNFQHCWTSGFIAGAAAADHAVNNKGRFLCMDHLRNFIVSETEETRKVAVIQRDGTESFEEKTRSLGLVMVPGKHLLKVEIEDADWEDAQKRPPPPPPPPPPQEEKAAACGSNNDDVVTQ
ncbi:hypothetical protein CTAYLR_007974 [Chrysophaeum taylorii]|uniref:Uncharacterized protein n=1 Tax=Chrysophaeum taylorii TaxID=2483200 RepID=A0AAD7UCA4_9STRA|nr:hypothetical protein CTAYLR_007974 [Chrysophaeum taylorii]